MTTLVLLVILYLIPWLVAAYRRHPNTAPIAVLNLLLGWTLIGWVGALVWSLLAIDRERDRGS